MRTKKDTFGFFGNLGVLVRHRQTEWTDQSSWLLGGDIPLLEIRAHGRLWLAYGVIFVFATVFAVRLGQLQISQVSQNRLLADGNRVRRDVIVAPRGAIVDARGESLVTNTAGFELAIIPADLPFRAADRTEVLKKIEAIKGISISTVTEKINRVGRFSHNPVSLLTDVPREEAILDKIRFAETPGVAVRHSTTRHYDSTSGLSHLLGYTSQMSDHDISRHPDYFSGSPIGRAGLEASYDAQLRGIEGYDELEVNAAGQFQRNLDHSSPVIGKTLYLTLDNELQAQMAKSLKEAMEKQSVNQAVGIAMDPQTGGILASVSLPHYDNNLFAKTISADDYQKITDDANKPLLNRAVDGIYPVGSAIKPFVAAAALQEKTVTPQTTLDTSAGEIVIGDFRFPDWKKHGTTTITDAIAQSNDIYFYALGGGWKHIPPLGVERLGKYFSMFGLGKETGVDYTSESKGLVPDPEWKKRAKGERWYIGDTFHISIGQGDLLVTPIQLARALSGLVNGGRLPTPHIVAATEDASGKTALSFPEQKLALSDQTIAVVREGMALTVSSDAGSARSLQSLPFRSGGKTGTAQFGTKESDKTHAWYVGYAPLDNPKIVVVILVEGGGEGNAISVPVAAQVFESYLKPS